MCVMKYTFVCLREIAFTVLKSYIFLLNEVPSLSLTLSNRLELTTYKSHKRFQMVTHGDVQPTMFY